MGMSDQRTACAATQGISTKWDFTTMGARVCCECTFLMKKHRKYDKIKGEVIYKLMQLTIKNEFSDFLPMKQAYISLNLYLFHFLYMK